MHINLSNLGYRQKPLAFSASDVQRQTSASSTRLRNSFVPLPLPRRANLPPLLDEHHIAVLFLGRIDEGAESLEFFRVLEGGFPLALVGADDGIHLGFQFRADAQL